MTTSEGECEHLPSEIATSQSLNGYKCEGYESTVVVQFTLQMMIGKVSCRDISVSLLSTHT